MATHSRNQVERRRCPGIVHLELWDALIEGRPLFDWQREPGFPRALSAAVELLLAGELTTASGFVFPGACGAIETVWLGGGRPELASCAAMVGERRRVVVSEEPIFAAARAGCAWLTAELERESGNEGGVATPAVIDLGQTSAKVIVPGQAPTRIMRGGRGWQAVVAEACAALASAKIAAGQGRLLLGLPAELSGTGAGPCSYFEELSFEELAAHLPVPTSVVTDAELAGLAARAELLLASPILALTLGHGVGAALVLS